MLRICQGLGLRDRIGAGQRLQGLLDGGLQASALAFRVVVPGLRRDPVQVGNGPAQHRRAPDFPGASAGQEAVARGIAFDAQSVEPGIGVLDGKVQAEGIPSLALTGLQPRVRMNAATAWVKPSLWALCWTFASWRSVTRRPSRLWPLANSPADRARAYSR